MRTYTQLTQEQRYQIYALMKAGHNQSEIAHLINVHKSMISRELRRNCGMKGYRPKQAHQFTLNRRKKAKCRIKGSTWTMIETLLRKDWSPEQVPGWLKENYGLQISHEWIYRTFLWISKSEESSIAIYDARKSGESAMGATIVAEGSRTG